MFKQTSLLVTSLIYLSSAQVLEIDPNTGEVSAPATADESLDDTSEEGTVEPEFPRYTTTTVDIIPKGATEHNYENFYMTGDYSTVQDVYGDITFEVNMKVHHNHLPQYDGWVYMVWL